MHNRILHPFPLWIFSLCFFCNSPLSRPSFYFLAVFFNFSIGWHHAAVIPHREEGLTIRFWIKFRKESVLSLYSPFRSFFGFWVSQDWHLSSLNCPRCTLSQSLCPNVSPFFSLTFGLFHGFFNLGFYFFKGFPLFLIPFYICINSQTWKVNHLTSQIFIQRSRFHDPELKIPKKT